jgi:beta-N-acetylhexosaminidase
LGASDPALHNLVTNTRGIGPNEPVAAYSVFKRELERYQCQFTEIRYDLLETLFSADSYCRIDQPLVIVTEDYPLPGLDYDADKQALIVQQAVRKFGDSVIVIALRSDYELAHFPELPTYICTYSSRACSAIAAAHALLEGMGVSTAQALEVSELLCEA